VKLYHQAEVIVTIVKVIYLQHLNKTPGKTPIPNDAEKLYKQAVPDSVTNPKAWHVRSPDNPNSYYRYSGSNDGTAHFTGEIYRDLLPTYAKDRLK